MAEGGFDERDPLIPHGEDHDGEEEEEQQHGNHGLDFREDHYSPSKDKRKPDVKERARKLVQSYLRQTGLIAPDDLYYTTWIADRGEIKLISLDKRYWHEILAGPEGTKIVRLVPAGYNDQPAPPELYRRIGADDEEGGGDESTPLIRKEEEKEEAGVFLKRVFEKPALEKVFAGKDQFGRTWVSLMRSGATTYVVTEDGLQNYKVGGGSGKPSDRLRKALGETKAQTLEEAQMEFSRNEDRINDLKSRLAEAEKTAKSQRDQIKRFKDANQDLERMVERRNREVNDLKNKLKDSTSPSERKKLEKEISDLNKTLAQQKQKNAETIRANQEKIRDLEDDLNMTLEGNMSEAEKERIQEEIAGLEKENEALEKEVEETFSGLSLKDKIKFIFKKYGVTVVGVTAAVGTVIGVIVSNLRAGLTKVAKGVGNGLKDLGKKLAGILPGMVGAIVSFLFKTAGEAVGFLAKHAWLLILLVVTFVIEQYKK